MHLPAESDLIANLELENSALKDHKDHLYDAIEAIHARLNCKAKITDTTKSVLIEICEKILTLNLKGNPMSECILLDTETTGLIEPIIPWEIAWISLNPDYQISLFYHEYFNPEKQIELGALATSFTWNDDLENYPPASSFVFPSDVSYIIGHNIDYDWKVLGSPDVKRICTKALASKYFPDLDSYSQSALICYLYGKSAKKMLKEAHTAVQDVQNCHLLLHAILDKLENKIPTFEELWLLSEDARIPSRCALGEHRGKLWKDVPESYRNWMLKQSFVDSYAKQAIKDSFLADVRDKVFKK